MRASQLAKQHGHKLAPTGEAPRVPLGLVLLDRLLEIPARKKLQHLRKNAAYFVHRLSLLRLNWFLKPNPAYQELSLLIASLPYAFHHPVISLIWTAVSETAMSSVKRRYGIVL